MWKAASVMAAQETRGDCAQESSIVSKHDGMRRILEVHLNLLEVRYRLECTILMVTVRVGS